MIVAKPIIRPSQSRTVASAEGMILYPSCCHAPDVLPFATISWGETEPVAAPLAS
ncbi:MAG: hypothetical protein N2512_03090 [Armatimonadetes bacterium]|nr:hypothetical protein [Armatimonadota bacterium]